MSLFTKLFGSPAKQRTLLDDAQEVSSRLIVKGYRKIAAQHCCAPTAKTTDKKIIEIYNQVLSAFQDASKKRGERISAPVLNYVALKFLQVYETTGDHFYLEHLQYEISKYLAEGLRADYKQELPLFDPDGNDPDVKRLHELMDRAVLGTTGKETKPSTSRPNNPPVSKPPLLATDVILTECPKCGKQLRFRSIERDARIRCPACEFVFKYSNGKHETTLNPETPVVILNSAIEAAEEARKIAELAASIEFTKETSRALLKEIISYYSKVAISAVMIKRGWHGKDRFMQTKTEVFNALCGNLSRRQYQFEDFIDENSRLIAEAYFVKSTEGLDITEEQVYAFAENSNQQDILSKMPDDQLDIFYYTMRVSRLLEAHPKINGVIGYYISQKLVTQLGAFSDQIQTVVNTL